MPGMTMLQGIAARRKGPTAEPNLLPKPQVWTGFPSLLILLFEADVLGSFSGFPALWGAEIKPFSITHLSQESGKGSEEGLVVLLLSSLKWMSCCRLSTWGFQAGVQHCCLRICPNSAHLIPSFWSRAAAEHKAHLSHGPSCPKRAPDGCQPHYPS